MRDGVCVAMTEGVPDVVTEKKPHIKKPLNAFMLYMKEMRAKVVAECTLKESAAINQILGRKVGAHCMPPRSTLLLLLLLLYYYCYYYCY